MFLAQAHSFTQQARLAITLAWVGGYTNILTLLTCGQATSHMSGMASKLGQDVAEGAWTLGSFALTIIVSFFVGALLSGACTEIGRRRGWESIYVLPMTIEAMLLTAFAIGVEIQGSSPRDISLSIYILTILAALAMGLQNATITRISNGVVRTTHVTGVVTDLGLETAQLFLWLWDSRHNSRRTPIRALVHTIRNHPSPKRLVMLAALLFSFAGGAALGTLVFHQYPRWAMFVPVVFLLWIIFQDVSRPIAEIELSDLLDEEAGLGLPAALGIYHLRKTPKGKDRPHRMPDLIGWLDRLPPTTDVVVLDLGHDSEFDAAATVELRAAVLKMKLAGRRLILGGIDNAQMKFLQKQWGSDLHAEDVCQDLDLAIAHALNVLESLPR